MILKMHCNWLQFMTLNIKGAVITLDALHCQIDTLELIHEHKAQIVVQVKSNQPNLRKAVQEQFQVVFDAGKKRPLSN